MGMALVTRDKAGNDKVSTDKHAEKPVEKLEKNLDKNQDKHHDKSSDKKPPADKNPQNIVSAERVKALGLAMDAIKKQFGEGSIMKLGDSRHAQIETIPTGALSLDVALGIGGIPRGRVIEIYGPESSGKTTLAQHVAAEVQKKGGIAAIVDAEHAMDPEYARKLGVNVDELLISQPDTGEQALEITEQLVRSGAVDLVIVDSVAALVPKAEIEGEMGDALPGLQARLMSQALRKLTGIISKTHTAVIFINQLRQKIGVMYGNPETTTGGNALKFYASVRLDIRKIETLKKDGSEYGNRVKVKVVKNKMAPPFRIAEFDIIYGKGISTSGCILDMAAEMDIVKKSGSWFSYNDERLGQGREATKTFLEQNQKLMTEIEAKVKNEINQGRIPGGTAEE